MKRTFVIFIQLGTEADNNDPVQGYVHGTNRDAQELCNKLNDGSSVYYYYMELDDLKAHGFRA